MKKIFGLMAMVAVMFAASCQKESLKVSAQGEVDATFSVQLPEVLATKAISDGQKADVLYYMPYAVTANGDDVPVYTANAVEEVVNGEARVTVRLVKGETYKIVFWAQDADCTAYNVSDMTDIKVTYGTAGNDENRDAFYTCKTISVNADGTLSGLDADNKIRLYRPFAQINFGAVAEDWAMMAPFITNGLTSAVSFKAKVPTTLNGLTGVAGTLADASFTAGPAPLGEDLEANNSTYTWVSMNYILAGARNTMNVEAVFTYDGGKSQTVSVADVPFERNFRTNILGYFFTTQEVIDIIIVPGFVNAETGADNPDIIVAYNTANASVK